MSFRSFSLEQLLSTAALGLLTGYLVARATTSGKKTGKKNVRKENTQDKAKKSATKDAEAAGSSKENAGVGKSSKAIDEDSEEYLGSDEDEDDFTTEDESEGEDNDGLKAFDHKEEYKMVLVIRTDLGMGKGKAAAQCCHACLANYRELAAKQPGTLKRWEYYSGQAKVTLKIDSEEDMLKLQQHARQVGLAAHSIRDAGRTQIAAGSRTVLAVGPGPISVINQVTGHLKLY
ncbi:hypothetical protein DFQ26_008764 [Actinomortierella ambigua]|nr:hypothetical protein DFQ26_008764 [Actinomortierella ambigua]